MIQASYKIFDSENEVTPPYEVARPLPDGKVVGKTDDETAEGMKADEIIQFVKDNYPTDESDN